jgi:hypothetical protein
MPPPRKTSAVVLPYESGESMDEKTVQLRPGIVDLAATNDFSSLDEHDTAAHRTHKVLGVPKWAPQYIQTHGDDADMYRARERRESGPHDYSEIIRLQSEMGLFKGVKLFGVGGNKDAAADLEAVPAPALKLAQGIYINYVLICARGCKSWCTQQPAIAHATLLQCCSHV